MAAASIWKGMALWSLAAPLSVRVEFFFATFDNTTIEKLKVQAAPKTICGKWKSSVFERSFCRYCIAFLEKFIYKFVMGEERIRYFFAG